MISELCVFTVETGSVEVVLRHDGHIEAPNWHPKGYLIVNGGGEIYRVPLHAPKLERIDTGFARACNNDHGVSPDGRRLAISDKTEHGESCIYVMPIEGGTPEKVTSAWPSWFHGWAPDGQSITYVGAQRRDRVVRPYVLVPGEAETELVDGFDHIDGPDFTPEGAWIWFNGERDGAVDLWRVRPDGGALERMTEGETVDWFPHPSPCGRHVVFIAYPPGTVGHPFGVEVELCLMPQEGGAVRSLGRIFGGQGCLNVPCWSPDGASFAFVRYEVDAA